MVITEVIDELYSTCNAVSRFDAAYIAFHALLVTNGYKCVGIGDEADNECDVGDSLLPDWNKSSHFYTIRYKNEFGSRLLVKAVIFDSILSVHVLTRNDELFDLDIDVERYIKDEDQFAGLKGKDVYQHKKLPRLLETYRIFMVEKLKIIVDHDNNTSENLSTKSADFLRGRPPYQPMVTEDPRVGIGRMPYPSYGEPPFFNPDGDRIPGRGGGSMFFDPLRSGPIRPPGRGPMVPGVRYDPVGPFNLPPDPEDVRRTRSYIDPDHFAPPGFGSNFQPPFP